MSFNRIGTSASAKLADVNTTSLRAAAELGCQAMSRFFNPDDHDVGAPYFWINLRPTPAPVAPDSGVHIALRAPSTAAVDAFHAAALAAGGTSDGGPGLDGDIQFTPGDRIPQIPRHSFKAYANYDPTSRLDVDLDFVAVSSSFARGSENNQDQPDGIYYLGQPVSPGYGVVNIGARYRFRHVEAFVRIDNLLNHKYYTAAQLGTTPYDNNGNFVARPFPPVNGEYPIRSSTFFAPGSPIDVFGGLKVRF